MKSKRHEMIMALLEACEDVIQVQTAPDYAEPGYTVGEAGLIAFANWNDKTELNEEKTERVKSDETPSLLCTVLETLGVDIEWEDEWSTCSDCGKAFRTSPNSHGWTPSSTTVGGDEVCHECIKENPSYLLEELQGDENRALTISGIKLEDHDYVKLQDGFENGFHHGQDASPKVISQSLRELGVTRFIFVIDDVGQFDVTYSVWIHEDEFETLDMTKWDAATKDGPSVSGAAMRALQGLSGKLAFD